MSINSVGWLNKPESQSTAQNLLQEAANGSQDAIDSICSGIFDSTAGRLGTNETFVREIFNNADSKTLASIMDRYREVTGSEIFKDIENDFSGKEEDALKEALNSAYKSVNQEEYTGWDDGQLNDEQIAKSVFKGVKNEALGIGAIVGGTILAPVIASVVGTALTAVAGAGAAAAIATVGAPILAVTGIIAAGCMIYKGVTNTKQAIEQSKNSQSDATTMDAVTSGTQGVINTAEGIYIGAQSVKGLVESVKNIKTYNANKKAVQAEAQSRIEEEAAIKQAQQAQDELIEVEYNKNPSSTSKELHEHPGFQNKNGGYSAEESAKYFETQGESELEISLNNQGLNNASRVSIDELDSSMPECSKGTMKKLKNFLKRDAVGAIREQDGYTIKKISENEFEILNTKASAPASASTKSASAEEMKDAILRYGRMNKTAEQYERFEAEINAVYTTQDSSKLEVMYDSIVQYENSSTYSNLAKTETAVNDYKSSKYKLFNTLLRKTQRFLKGEVGYIENYNIENAKACGYTDNDIQEAWRPLNDLSKFLKEFSVNRGTELLRTDGYGALESVEIKSGMYEGRSLGELLANQAEGKEIINMKELIRALKGQEIVQEGFLSTSILQVGAEQCHRDLKPILWNFITQGRTNGCYIDIFAKSLSNEYECLIDKGALISIRDLQFKNGKWLIYAFVRSA